jgi:hypothetical protein
LENEDHVTKVLADLDSTHKLWRGITFRDKVDNISKLLDEWTWWHSDQVHPTVEGYNRMANFITKGFRAMLDKDDSAEGTAGGEALPGAAAKGPWRSACPALPQGLPG